MKIRADEIRPGEEITLLIEDLNQQGQGVGRQAGLVIFVDGAIPQDLVQAVITKRQTNYAVARLVALIQPSPDRIEPACSLSGRCGGCTLQMMSYTGQLAYKERLVSAALSRIGKIELGADTLKPILGMADPWHYRNKVQFPVAGSYNQPLLGFYASRSHTVVDGEICPIQYPVFDVIRKTVRQHIIDWQISPYDEAKRQGLLRHLVIRLGFATGDLMVIFVINGQELPGQAELIKKLHECIEDNQEPELPPLRLASVFLNFNKKDTNVILGNKNQLLAGKAYIEEEILGIRSRISPQTFFQINSRQTALLYEQIMSLANLKGTEQVLDLYCGSGAISLQLAKKAKSVLGIEIVEAAVIDARENARLNQISNVSFKAGKAEKILSEIWQDLKADLIVLDPPRKGCEREVIKTIGKLLPAKLIYVSCNPATLARDLSLLCDYGYEVSLVQPVDMFPWTSHVECVVLITRNI